MRRYFSIGADYFAQYLKARVAYKGDFLITIANSFLATAASFGFVLIVFSRIPNLKGWSFYELMFIYSFSLLPLGIFNIVSLNLYQFGEVYVIEGKFDRVLLRPLSSLFQVIFEAFRLEAIQELLTGIVLLGYCARKLNITWNPANIALLILMTICAAAIYLAIFLILTAVSFWMEDRIGITPPVFNMIGFGRYPLTIYNTAIQFFLSWIIPFAFASFYPTTGFLKRNEFQTFFYLVPVVAGVLSVLSVFVWNRGVRRYSSTGS